MSYLRHVLRPDETVVFHGRLHWLIYLSGLLVAAIGLAILVAALLQTDQNTREVAAITAIAVLLIAAWMLIVAGIRRRTTEYVVTDKRVIYKTGWFSRHTAEMNISKVESVDVDQNLLGRVFGYGTVFVRGTGASMEPLPRVADPIALRNAIMVG